MPSCTHRAAFLLSFYFWGDTLRLIDELLVTYHLRRCAVCRADLRGWKDLKLRKASGSKIA